MTLEPGLGARALAARPPGFRPVRNGPVLLYPEGAVLLNDTGNAILELVDGRRTVARSPRILGERYQTDVTADVTEYLSHLAERELIRDRLNDRPRCWRS